jgi:hypothetical protein
VDQVSGERRRLSYLLRLWQAEQEGAVVWRASLESASDRFGRPGERRGFASLAELYAFLEQETVAVNEGKPRSPSRDELDLKPKAYPETDG